MRAVDTNVLVRVLTQDDPAQAAHAAALVRDAEDAGLFVPEIVLCELVWVLDRAYGFKRDEIADALGDLLNARQFAFERLDRARRTLEVWRSGKGDFADYLVREAAEEAGCVDVATFDKALLRERGFAPP